jgi:hypothetical protein
MCSVFFPVLSLSFYYVPLRSWLSQCDPAMPLECFGLAESRERTNLRSFPHYIASSAQTAKKE